MVLSKIESRLLVVLIEKISDISKSLVLLNPDKSKGYF
jgi:hypothetical protein